MADEMMEEKTPDPVPPTDEGGTNANRTPTQKIFDKYRNEDLTIAKQTAEGVVDVACLAYEQGKTSTQIQVCRIQDVQLVRNEYRSIQNVISSSLGAYSTAVNTKLEEYLKKEKSLTEKLTASLTALKEVKSKLGEVNQLACKLEKACTDSCNSNQLKELNRLDQIEVTIVEGGKEKKKKVKGTERFKFELKGIASEVQNCYDHADNIFEYGIKYAGIQASMNVESLKEAIARLTKDAEGLVTNVADSSNSLDEKLLKQQETLHTEIGDLTESLADSRSGSAAQKALLKLDVDLGKIADEADCENAELTDQWEDCLIKLCEGALSTFKRSSSCPTADDSGTTTNIFNPLDAPQDC